jgi:peptidoglycan/xylan/chitin deacetylase (PgdA/CDA1 family)
MDKPVNPFSSISFRRDRIAWGLFFLLSFFIFGGSYFWLHRKVVPASSLPFVSIDDPRIVVLAYDHVVKGNDGVHIDRRLFQEHLEALQEQGFTPIALSALADFYERGQPLPSNPLLLTFDHGYLDTYTAVDSLLRETEWRAAMFIKTSRLEERDTFFLYWDRLQRMIDSGLWEIGSNGRIGNEPVPTDGAGATGPFLARRMWREKEGRTETDPELEERIGDDYRSSREAIAKNLNGVRPVAFAAPFGDFSRISDDAVLIRKNQEASAAAYPLGFSDDRFGINDRRSDPHRLKRLRVDPGWSGAELVRRLAAALQSLPDGRGAEGKPVEWIAGEGRVSQKEKLFSLEGSPRTDLWIPGTAWSEEWVMEADLSIDAGSFWLVQESATGHSWRWGGGPDGLSLQHRTSGGALETLSRFTADMTPGNWHHLKIVKRGRGIWIEWDRRPLTLRPIYLPGPSRGPLGWVGWRTDGTAALRIANLHLARHPGEIRQVEANPSQKALVLLAKEAPQIAAISPPWLTVAGGGRRVETALESELFSILSHRYGWEILPTVRVTGKEGKIRPVRIDASSGAPVLDDATLAELLGRVEKKGWGGIYLDLRELSPSSRQALDPLLHRWTRLFQKKGLRLADGPDLPPSSAGSK